MADKRIAVLPTISVKIGLALCVNIGHMLVMY